MKKYIAECIGSFALVFCGTGAIIVNEQTDGSLGLIGIALTFGILVTAMVYVFGNISGAHINPSVTIALTIIGQLVTKKLLIETLVLALKDRNLFPLNNGLSPFYYLSCYIPHAKQVKYHVDNQTA